MYAYNNSKHQVLEDDLRRELLKTDRIERTEPNHALQLPQQTDARVSGDEPLIRR